MIVFLGANSFVSIDLDECAQTTKVCHPQANCTNVPGSFTCQCKSGFSGNGATCTGKTVKPQHSYNFWKAFYQHSNGRWLNWS